MNHKPFFNVLLCALASTLVISAIAAAPAAASSVPEFDAANFAGEPIDNPFFPLEPGTTFVYEGESEGVPTREVVEVTFDTREILGVTTTVVHALAYEGEGKDEFLIEETFDWYAQDTAGNVWYFGEDTKEFDEVGNVISTEGSWEAGVNGAEAGIIMLADPKKGDRYRQENAPDVAEDMAQVIGFEDSLCLSNGECYENILVTKEWTPLERGVVEYKYYAEGVGFIYGETIKGGEEFTELVRVR